MVVTVREACISLLVGTYSNSFVRSHLPRAGQLLCSAAISSPFGCDQCSQLYQFFDTVVPCTMRNSVCKPLWLYKQETCVSCIISAMPRTARYF